MSAIKTIGAKTAEEDTARERGAGGGGRGWEREGVCV